jgi:hypothetical protein
MNNTAGEALGHAPGEGVDGGLGPPAELKLVKQLGGRVGAGPGAQAEQTAVVVEVFPAGELPVERVLLGHNAEQLLGQGRMGDHVDAAHEGGSRRRDHPGGEHAGGGRLAGAVRAEEPKDLAPPDPQLEVVDRLEVGSRIDLGQPLGSDDLVDRTDHGRTSPRSPNMRPGQTQYPGQIRCGTPGC